MTWIQACESTNSVGGRILMTNRTVREVQRGGRHVESSRRLDAPNKRKKPSR